MNTRNTTKSHVNNRVDRALLMLEALQHPDSKGVLQYLLEHGQASFLELTISTGLDSESLEMQLELLCGYALILQKESLLEADWYEPNTSKLRRVTMIARQLAGFHLD